MLIDLIWPKSCELCGKSGSMICKKCYLELEEGEPRCAGCGNSSPRGITHKRCKGKTALEGLKSVFAYKDHKVAAVVLAFKYDGRWALIEELVRLTGRPEWDFDCVAFVPMHSSKGKERGYNQAKLIAVYLAKMWRVELLPGLIKTKNTKSLALSESLEIRKSLVKGAYGYKGADLAGRRILLVDDVFTSGATMNEVAGVLKNAGASQIWGWSLAS